MEKYTEVVVTKITKKQKSTLEKLKSNGVNPSKFVRDAIREKIQKEGLEIMSRKTKRYCPFGGGEY